LQLMAHAKYENCRSLQVTDKHTTAVHAAYTDTTLWC